MGWYLAIDLGTGGAKVAAVRPDGTLIDAGFEQIDTVRTPDGGAEQDAESWWSAVTTLVRALTVPDRTSCDGVGITGQWASTVPVDDAGRPVGPCLLWQDGRGSPWSKRAIGGTIDVAGGFSPKKLAQWVRLTGAAPSKDGADPTGHALFLRHRRSEQHGRAAFLCEPLDVIGARLTGRVAATPASMVASWLTDNRPGAPAGYHPDLVRAAQRDVRLLPPLLPTGSVLGPLDPLVATDLGLPASTPVVAGVPDLHTAAIGSGGVHDFQGHVAISTSGWVSAPVPFKKTAFTSSMASIPGFRDGSYLIVNNHETGGAALRWLRDLVFPGSSYDELSELAATAPPGSGGVIFTPWLSGERSPVENHDLRASFLNMGLTTGRAELARSVLEGVAYANRWLLEAVEEFAERGLDGVRLLGGGAQSELWCQIHADVLGRAVDQVTEPMHVNVRGAAWFAAVALGGLSWNDVAAMAPTSRRFEPQTKATDPLYAEFTKLAKSQKAMFGRLARLRG
jgi:xylulokinase